MVPIVSIIIPAYNRASTIHKAIQSVFSQTYANFEIVVVDDGSTDQTSKLVREFVDPRIRLICHEKNLGAAAARNTGMKAAIGEYIAWLDSDDEWLSEKLEIQLRSLQQAPSYQKASYTAFERVERGESRLYIPEHTNYRKLFLGCDQAPGSTLLFRRELLDEIGFLDVSMRRYEDWDWLLRYCKNYGLLPIDRPLAKIHFVPERPSGHVEASAKEFVSKYSDTLRQFGIYRNVVISRRWIEVASYYAREHNLVKVLFFLGKGLTIYPFQPLDVWAWLVNAWFNVKIGDWLAMAKNKVLRFLSIRNV